MDSEPTANDSTDSPPTIRCLHCDYDLRGLPDDPIRCPECGQYTSYAEFVRRRARRSKAGFYSTWAAIVFPVMCLSIPASIATPACAACGLLPMVILWLVLLAGVRREAGGSPNWVALFLKHQIAALPVVLLAIASVPVCVGTASLMIWWIESIHRPAARSLAAALFSMAVVAVIATGFYQVATRVSGFAGTASERLNACPPRHERSEDRGS